MNNWSLLLLAVIAALQPIGSFTEPNLIDGREECCNHRSNSITQATSLYGNYRKLTPEERRLNTREDIREERRYEAQSDPVTRLSRERLTLERAERRISPQPTVRFTAETRFARYQDRRNRISVDARESRQARERQDRRTRESVSGDSSSQHERDVLDSRRTSMSRDNAGTERIGKERLYRASANSRDARRLRNAEDLRRVSLNRKTMAVLSREMDDETRGIVRRNSRVNAFRSVTTVHLDDDERRTLDRRAMGKADEPRRSRSLDSRVNSVNEREDFRSRIDLREDRRSSFEVISERIEERRQRDNREYRDGTSAGRRDSAERISADRKRDTRDTVEQVDRTRRNIREKLEKIDERRQQRVENRPSRERMLLRESNHRTSTERRQALSRESRILNANTRSERIVRSSDRTDERMEPSRDVLRMSRDSTSEHRPGSRTSRMLEATFHNERLVTGDEIRNDRMQPSARSLDRVSELRRSSDSRSIERENNFGGSTRFSERKVRNDRPARYRRDVRSVERLDERRQQRDERIMSRDRTVSMLRKSRGSAQRRQESRSTENVSRLEARARFERESRIRDELRDNVRVDVNRREREERRASSDQTLHRIARHNEHKHDREMSSTSGIPERALSSKRDARSREDLRGDRIVVRREVRDENRESRDRTVAMQRLTRDVLESPRRHDTRRTSRNDETFTRIQPTRYLDQARNERREVRERGENRASRESISMTRVSRENIEDQRREARGSTNNFRAARNELTRNREEVRMIDRLEVRRQQDESRQYRASLQRQPRDSVAARSNKVTSRDAEINMQSERLTRSRVERRISGLMNPDSRRVALKTTEREVQPNRHNLAMERMERQVNRSIRDGFEAKLRFSDIVFAKDVRTDTKHTVDSRFRTIESNARELDSVDEKSDDHNALTWQMIFYSLQGAYLCSLLMQILTEKSSKGKAGNFSWWSPTSNDLVKVD